MKTFTIVDYNFAVPADISICSSFSKLERAFEIALTDVLEKGGRNITLHNAPDSITGDYRRVDTRLTNNNSLGSSYGISYDSKWGSFPCSRIIMEREVRE